MKCAALFLLAFGIGFGQSPLQQAPESWRSKANPFADNEKAVRAGSKLYARECAACHGENGQGISKAPPLKRADVSNAPPGAVFWVLDNGAIWHGMPSFAHLPAPERWQIVTFVQGLAGSKKPN